MATPKADNDKDTENDTENRETTASKAFRWDEPNLRDNECVKAEIRERCGKIDEPKTPYHPDEQSDEEGEEGEEGGEGEEGEEEGGGISTRHTAFDEALEEEGEAERARREKRKAFEEARRRHYGSVGLGMRLGRVGVEDEEDEEDEEDDTNSE